MINVLNTLLNSTVRLSELQNIITAVMQSRNNFKKLELAQASIDGVKVEGIDTNVAVMKVCCLLSKFRPFKLSFSSNCLCIDIGYVQIVLVICYFDAEV